MAKTITRISTLLLALLMVLSTLGGCAELVDTLENALSTESVESGTQSSADVITSEEGSEHSSNTASDETDDTTSEELASAAPNDESSLVSSEESVFAVDENGTYTSAEDVALYIHTYNKLPDNFITKNEARALGWEGGSVEKYAPGKCIGGDRFGNYEGLLPEKNGRTYTECDIDTLGANSRGAKRIVFSNDGLVYYTDDHYETFTLLYGEE